MFTKIDCYFIKSRSGILCAQRELLADDELSQNLFKKSRQN